MRISLKKHNSNIRATGLVFLSLIFNVTPAIADDHCLKERDPLPSCLIAQYIEVGEKLINTCDHEVVVKVDIARARDRLVKVGANQERYIESSHEYKLFCCPRLSSCQ